MVPEQRMKQSSRAKVNVHLSVRNALTTGSTTDEDGTPDRVRRTCPFCIVAAQRIVRVNGVIQSDGDCMLAHTFCAS